MKAAIYIRVSTQEQADEGYSIGAQTEKLKAYCKAKGWSVYHIYTDPGFSGSNTDRPALNQMLRDVKKREIDAVVVYKLDRLSRSQKDTLYLIEDVFLAHNVEFVSMNENFDTSTPFGRAMIGILSVFAQLEREQIRERMTMGLIERAKDGYWHGGGYDPIGYDYVDGELKINEYEALQVREIYKLFLAGTPIDRIQKTMRKKYTNKYGSWANHTSIRSVLTTPIYIGKITYCGEIYDGRHEAIIDEETYQKAQKRYDDISWTKGSGEHKKRPFQAKHLLTGLLYCGNCGARYFGKGNYSGRGENKRYYPYYTCYSRAKTQKRMIIDPDCRNESYPVFRLDDIITKEIMKLSFDPSYFKLLQDTKYEEPENNNAVLESRINDIDAQMKRILDLYQFGNIPMKDLSSRIDNLNREKQSLIDQIVDEEDPQEPAISVKDAKDLLATAANILDNGSLAERRELVHALIDSIELVDQDIVIRWAFV